MEAAEQDKPLDTDQLLRVVERLDRQGSDVLADLLMDYLNYIVQGEAE